MDMGSSILVTWYREGDPSLPSLLTGVSCGNASKNMDHLLLHCPVASILWAQLFRETALTWVIPTSCNALLRERYSFIGGKKQGVVLGRWATMALFWVLLMERKRRAFYDVKGEGVEKFWLHFGPLVLQNSSSIRFS